MVALAWTNGPQRGLVDDWFRHRCPFSIGWLINRGVSSETPLRTAK